MEKEISSSDQSEEKEVAVAFCLKSIEYEFRNVAFDEGFADSLLQRLGIQPCFGHYISW